MPVLVSTLTTTPPWRGALSGLLVTVLCAVVPVAVVLRGVRRGRYASLHVPRREDRPPLLAMVAGLTALAAVLLVLLDGATSSLVFLGLTVSRRWKISLHAMVAAASAVVLVGLVPVTFPALLAVPLVAAARVRLGAHTVAQVVVGSVVGAALAAASLAVV
jgi:membrane-associated phospholipid phosphatase